MVMWYIYSEDTQDLKIMKRWATEIIAIDPADGELKTWAGPQILAWSREHAEHIIQNSGLGFCRLLGTVEEEIEETDWIEILRKYVQHIN